MPPSSPPSKRRSITSKDIVSIKGRHLFVGDGNSSRRFFLRGIAFPIPPPSETKHYYFDDDQGTTNLSDVYEDRLLFKLELSGWISVLEQLASDTDINVVRLYEMDCRFDYSPFLTRAAELGIYVLVPLTTIMGPGVLGRDEDPPACYPPKLYHYGTRCLDNYWSHPNVLAGVVGNEVMNDLEAWGSAPCVKAYLDDMARYGEALGNRIEGTRRSLPLMYAAQHDSPSAEQLPADAIKLTADYLSCKRSDNDSNQVGIDSKNGNILENSFIMGINIESWCSSLQTFELEENGVDESSYHVLWRTLSKGTMIETTMDAVTGETSVKEVPTVSPDPITFPAVFSEMGCSKKLFNRDNGVQPKFVRYWKQIPVVSENGEMSDVISGFVAYGYDGGGNAFFRMMGSEGAWDGVMPLPTTSLDYENFRKELSNVAERNNRSGTGGVSANQASINDETRTSSSLSCKEISAKLNKLWDVDLYPIADMPSYYSSSQMLGKVTDMNAKIGRVDASFLQGKAIYFSQRLPSSMPTTLITMISFATLFAVAVQYWRRKKEIRTRVFLDHTDYGSCEAQIHR